MSATMLALVVRVEREHPGGTFADYDVIDSRSGEPLASRSELESANEIAVYLNSTYPVIGGDLSSDKFCAPAHDTLVHEIACLRVGGEEASICLETWLMLHQPFSAPLGEWCPWGVPVGPGWDHLYTESDR